LLQKTAKKQTSKKFLKNKQNFYNNGAAGKIVYNIGAAAKNFRMNFGAAGFF
jgi:hypothetical protein